MRYVHLPATSVDTQLLEDATRRGASLYRFPGRLPGEVLSLQGELFKLTIMQKRLPNRPRRNEKWKGWEVQDEDRTGALCWRRRTLAPPGCDEGNIYTGTQRINAYVRSHGYGIIEYISAPPKPYESKHLLSPPGLSRIQLRQSDTSPPSAATFPRLALPEVLAPVLILTALDQGLH